MTLTLDDTTAIYLVLIALGIAILIVIVDAVIMQRKLPQFSLMDFMGKAQWDFTKSWASTITLIGALLATVLGTKGSTLSSTSGTPITGSSPLSLYAALSLFFGILVVVAPLVYSATGKERTVDTPTHQQSLQYQGRVLSFLVTCTLTLWAVFGQLGTIIPLLHALTVAPDKSTSTSSTSFFVSPTIFMLQICVFGAIILVALYALTSIYWTVKEQVSPPAKEARKQEVHLAQVKYLQGLDEAERKSLLANPKTQKQLEPEQPTWSLL